MLVGTIVVVNLFAVTYLIARLLAEDSQTTRGGVTSAAPLPSEATGATQTTALTPSTQPATSTTIVASDVTPTIPEGREEDVLRVIIPTEDAGEHAPPQATLRDGKLVLEGTFRTSAEADRFVAQAADFVGTDNVVSDYTIDPAAPGIDEIGIALDKPVLFESGSAEIEPEYYEFLALCGDVMKLNPQITMVAEGFTDSVGSSEANLELSQRRAQAIVEFYRDYGIDESRFVTAGGGEDSPVGDNDTDEGRSQNRRTVLELLGVLTSEPERMPPPE